MTIHTHPDRDAYKTEAEKSAEHRAEDLAYTLNHAIACTVTDFIDPYVNQFIQNKGADYAPNWLKPYLAKVHIGCGHDHGHQVTGWQVWMPEFAGDFGSVPIVLAAQRFAPGAMHTVEKMLEPVVGTAFHNGAEKASKRWADRNGIAYDSEEYKQHVEDIYHHEISHLPQAALWTISSIGINAVAQRMAGNKNPWAAMIAGKAGGALFTSGLVVGTRMFAPKTVQSWDQATSKHIIAPGTRMIGELVGIDQKAIEHVLENEQDRLESSWEERLNQSSKSQTNATQASI